MLPSAILSNLKLYQNVGVHLKNFVVCNFDMSGDWKYS